MQCLSSRTHCRCWYCQTNWHIVRGYQRKTLITHCSGVAQWIHNSVRWVLASCFLLCILFLT